MRMSIISSSTGALSNATSKGSSPSATSSLSTTSSKWGEKRQKKIAVESIASKREYTINQKKATTENIHLVAQALKQSGSKLRKIELSNITNGFAHHQDFLVLMNALTASKHVREFCIENCKIYQEDARVIANFIRSNKKTFKTFGISKCPSLGYQGIAMILDAFNHNHFVRNLSVVNMGLGDEGVQAMVNMLSINTSIRGLALAGDVYDCIPCGAIYAMMKALEATTNSKNNKRTSLEALYLESVHIDEQDAKALSDLLKNSNTSISKLHLDDINPMEGVDLMKELGDGLRVNTTLTSLYLQNISNNPTTGGGIVALANALEQDNRTLERLELIACGIGNKGAIAMSRAIKENNAFQFVNFGEEHTIGKLGLVALDEAQSVHPSIKILCLRSYDSFSTTTKTKTTGSRASFWSSIVVL